MKIYVQYVYQCIHRYQVRPFICIEKDARHLIHASIEECLRKSNNRLLQSMSSSMLTVPTKYLHDAGRNASINQLLNIYYRREDIASGIRHEVL